MTEEQPFEVVRRYDGFALRRYPSHVVAEVTVELPFEQAGNTAFRYLFGYITGQNRSRTSVAMTAPVVQSAGAGQKVAMTAPVIQHRTLEGGYAVAFVLPASMTQEAAPEPTDPRVSIRTVPPSLAAAARYSGRWSQDSYKRHCRSLLQALEAEGLKAVGTPRFARFDPPFKPWFLRRNDIGERSPAIRGAHHPRDRQRRPGSHPPGGALRSPRPTGAPARSAGADPDRLRLVSEESGRSAR